MPTPMPIADDARPRFVSGVRFQIDRATGKGCFFFRKEFWNSTKRRRKS